MSVAQTGQTCLHSGYIIALSHPGLRWHSPRSQSQSENDASCFPLTSSDFFFPSLVPCRPALHTLCLSINIFSLLLYHRPLTPATAAVVGRLSSQGRLKIERDWTREADRDSAPFNGKGNSELVHVCGFQRQFSEPESSLPLFEQRYQRLNVSHRSDPHPVERRFHLSRYTCGVGATDNPCRKIPAKCFFFFFFF